MCGLTEGFGMAAMELITFDEDGNCIGSNFMDYLLPTAWETPKFELYETVTPSPHHPIGAKGVGESATVGSPAAYVNAVLDAMAHAGVREIDMPMTPDAVWEALNKAGLACGATRLVRPGSPRQSPPGRSDPGLGQLDFGFARALLPPRLALGVQRLALLLASRSLLDRHSRRRIPARLRGLLRRLGPSTRLQLRPRLRQTTSFAS